MLRFVLLFLMCIQLSSCRYWVLYEFAEQFCELENYVSISGAELGNSQIQPSVLQGVQIDFHEPVLNRPILLRYLNASPIDPQLSDRISKDVFSRSSTAQILAPSLEDLFSISALSADEKSDMTRFNFKLGYHYLDQHALLEYATLDKELSRLFTPAMIEPILRSFCSDDYDLGFKKLEMRFVLDQLPRQSLPLTSTVVDVFGRPESKEDSLNSLHYTFDFLSASPDGKWHKQGKPIKMIFDFDSDERLNNLYIHYHKYQYWLNLSTQSGRLIVIRRE